jgi:dolichol-phosphate mannosyltransferase
VLRPTAGDDQSPTSSLTIQTESDAGIRAAGVPILTVIVPCYNERLNVAPMIAALDAA